MSNVRVALQSDPLNIIRDAILSDATRFAGADIDTILTRIGTPATSLKVDHDDIDAEIADLITRTKGLDDIHDDLATHESSQSTSRTKIEAIQIPIQFPSAEALNDIAVTTPTDTTELSITVSLPTGASIVRVMLAAFITAMNNTANAQKIDVDVYGRVAAGTWTLYFSQDDCIGFPAADGATTGLVALQDVSALVTGAGTYGFKCTITQSSANSVRYTTQYILIITYKMS